MIDEQEFKDIQERFSENDATRERVITKSRDILKQSKKAIYALHRGESADEDLVLATKGIRELLPLTEKNPDLRHGMFGNAMEEYVEARAFQEFLKSGKLVTLKDLEFVQDEEYLRGLCDFTGELGRYAVHKATEKDEKAVQRVRDMMDMIFGQLLQFDFRNSELRRKYDSVKYNLKKVETLLCELQLRG